MDVQVCRSLKSSIELLFSCAYLQHRNLPVDYVRELFKPSKESVSLLACNETTFLVLDFLWVTS